MKKLLQLLAALVAAATLLGGAFVSPAGAGTCDTCYLAEDALNNLGITDPREWTQYTYRWGTEHMLKSYSSSDTGTTYHGGLYHTKEIVEKQLVYVNGTFRYRYTYKVNVSKSYFYWS